MRDSDIKAGFRARPLGQAYLSWPVGQGCGVYEAWCLWACWWCTCLPSQLSRVAASRLANPFPRQLADLQLTNKVVGTWGLDKGGEKREKNKKKNKKGQDPLIQGDGGTGLWGKSLFQCYLPALLLLFACMLDTVTDRRLSGRRAGVAGGESWLKALAIIRVAAEQETEKRNADHETTTKTNEYLQV